MKTNVKNYNGDWRIRPIYALGKEVGSFNHHKKEYTVIKEYPTQVFIKPKYRNAVGLSKSIIKQLLQLECVTLRFYIINFKENKERFVCTIDFKTFLMDSQDFERRGQKNSDEQRILSIYDMDREYLR